MESGIFQKLKSLGVQVPGNVTADGAAGGAATAGGSPAEAYLQELSEFLESFDFMRLGQAVSRGQWDGARMILRRMDQKAKALGLKMLEQPFLGLRQAIISRNVLQGKQIMASVTAKRVRLRQALQERNM